MIPSPLDSIPACCPASAIAENRAVVVRQREGRGHVNVPPFGVIGDPGHGVGPDAADDLVAAIILSG